MPCHLQGTKSLPNAFLSYSQLDPQGNEKKSSVKKMLTAKCWLFCWSFHVFTYWHWNFGCACFIPYSLKPLTVYYNMEWLVTYKIDLYLLTLTSAFSGSMNVDILFHIGCKGLVEIWKTILMFGCWNTRSNVCLSMKILVLWLKFNWILVMGTGYKWDSSIGLDYDIWYLFAIIGQVVQN